MTAPLRLTHSERLGLCKRMGIPAPLRPSFDDGTRRQTPEERKAQFLRDRANVRQIVERTSAVTRIGVTEILGSAKHAPIARARALSHYLVRIKLALSYPAAAEIFGSDHTTILHSVRKVAAALEDERGSGPFTAAVDAVLGNG